MKMKLRMRALSALLCLLMIFSLGCTGCAELLALLPDMEVPGDGAPASVADVDLDEIPPFTTEPYVTVNGNQPKFEEDELVVESYEFYSELDSLGRCGMTVACIGRDLMPTEERGSIGSVKPSGWQTVKYDIVDGKYLYNRCHLIGFQLTGENANEQNLITGTRYMNVEGMLPFENMVADYIKETGNHVLYRVTPVFDGDNLVARGVQLEAVSVEDASEGICFNVYVYNNQPGVVIDYLTGESRAEASAETTGSVSEATSYILNTKSKKFHLENCAQAQSISQSNMQIYRGDRDALIADGYVAAKCCNP